MKTFQTFLQEDFNSPKAMQFNLASVRENISIFFETLPNQPFDLKRYMKSFNSSSARETLKNTSDYWRALFFVIKDKIFVFVWEGLKLHSSLCRILEENVSLKKYPNLPFLQIYKNTLQGKILPNTDYVFAIVYDDGNLESALNADKIQKLITIHKIDNLFKLDQKTIEGLPE
jgi:hypothetical protein